MPELPEVEVVKKSLKRNICDLTIKNIDIRNKFLRYKIEEKIISKIVKSKVLSVIRRSKYIIINLSNSYSILVHLGMTGKIILINSKKKKCPTSFYYSLKNNNTIHDHLIFEFNKNIKLVYNDVRKFGFIKIYKTKQLYLSPHLKKLGPEPLSKRFDFNYFKEKIRKRRIFLKDLLMDQKFLAGLGNIYVNEVIFLSKINPRLKVNNLTDKEIISLVSNIKKVLKKAVKEGGSSIKDFNNIKGKKGNFQQFFNVYARQDEPCTRSNCIGTIRRIKISNRSTFFCGKCQN